MLVPWISNTYCLQFTTLNFLHSASVTHLCTFFIYFLFKFMPYGFYKSVSRTLGVGSAKNITEEILYLLSLVHSVVVLCLLLQVEYLCDRGADVNRGQRSSSLHYAACFGRPAVAKVRNQEFFLWTNLSQLKLPLWFCDYLLQERL